MWCFVAPITGRVDRHPDIHLIEMLPKVRPNPAYVRSDSVIKALQDGIVADMTVLLSQGMIYDHEQIVPL